MRTNHLHSITLAPKTLKTINFKMTKRKRRENVKKKNQWIVDKSHKPQVQEKTILLVYTVKESQQIRFFVAERTI